jgi:hypothetical protein
MHSNSPSIKAWESMELAGPVFEQALAFETENLPQYRGRIR